MGDPISQGDFPANPLEKPGYVLEFHDEFDGPELDTGKWLPFYLPHWSSRALSAPRHAFEGGHMVLQITQDQPPWCPEFDGEVRCSSLQTGAFAGPVGSVIGQHRFNKSSIVRETQDNVRLYTPQYGFFEIRAKAVAGAANHVSLWMIGYEDTPERSGEIAVMEIMGSEITATSSQIGYGVHPWGDPQLTDAFYQDDLAIDARDFHVYAVEWTPTRLDFYLDNVKLRTIAQSPAYPMQFMLSLYERPWLADLTDDSLYPKAFVVDYVRGFQPSGGYLR